MNKVIIIVERKYLILNLEKIAVDVLRYSENARVSEKVVIDISDNNDLTLSEFSKLCEILNDIGITILDNDSIVDKSTSNNIEKKYDHILSEFDKLTLEEKKQCYVLLGDTVKKLEYNAHYEATIKEVFMSKISKIHLQYSYICVFLKAFFQCNNSKEYVDLQELIDYHRDYYSSRRNNNLVVEQEDSIFSNITYSDADIRKIILFNPLKRSFLSNYYEYVKDKNTIRMNSSLFVKLSIDDIKCIIDMCDIKLEEYYRKLH